MATRALVQASLASLAAGLVFLGLGVSAPKAVGTSGAPWFAAHGVVLTLGAVLPGLAALHAWSLERLASTTLPLRVVRISAVLWSGGALVAAMGAVALGRAAWALEVAGLASVAAGATVWSVQVMRRAPKSGLADTARDPLTKGDDACLKHIHFAHRFLPLGAVLFVAAAVVAGLWPASAWGGRLALAAIHLLVIGYGLLSIYGLSHLWVPRLSGIPAIAAGAIKGELHASLLGIVGVTAGFLAGATTPVGRGLLVGLGPFVFLGFFVWMGVLGANIMKNKSPTNTVRPEFVYIPWVFSAVFWLVTAVLMGIFLNVLPEAMAHRFAALRFTHLHAGLLGGAVQLLLGLATRLLPQRLERSPPRFAGAMKGSFYLFNGGVAAAAYGRFSGTTDPWLLAGLAAVVVSLVLFARAMQPFMTPSRPAPA